MRRSSLSFVEEFEKGYDINKLLISLDPILKTVCNNTFKCVNYYIDKEDIIQNVRLHVWKTFEKKKDDFKGRPKEAFKYICTVIKAEMLKCIHRYEKKKTAIPKSETITIGSLNEDRITTESVIGIDALLRRLDEHIDSIKHGRAVYNSLTEPDQPEYAGLSPVTYYDTVRKLREKIEEVVNG
jgi:hypothetical protein